MPTKVFQKATTYLVSRYGLRECYLLQGNMIFKNSFYSFRFFIQFSAQWELGKYRHNSNVHTVSALHGNAVGKNCGQRGTEASEPVICH